MVGGRVDPSPGADPRGRGRNRGKGVLFGLRKTERGNAEQGRANYRVREKVDRGRGRPNAGYRLHWAIKARAGQGLPSSP